MRFDIRPVICAGVTAVTIHVPLLSAQTITPPAPKSEQITLTGCVERDSRGEYELTHAMIGRAGVSRSRSHTSGLSATAPPKLSETWTLEQFRNLDRYVGRRVEVTGHPTERRAASIELTSVRTVAATCP
jgi:hypothetical protein